MGGVLVVELPFGKREREDFTGEPAVLAVVKSGIGAGWPLSRPYSYLLFPPANLYNDGGVFHIRGQDGFPADRAGILYCSILQEYFIVAVWAFQNHVLIFHDDYLLLKGKGAFTPLPSSFFITLLAF